MKRFFIVLALALAAFTAGVATGAGLLLANPKLPLSAITIDMHDASFKFRLDKLTF
jgi:hypothetical protein